jgi:probable F420-dependent oxidoreductase
MTSALFGLNISPAVASGADPVADAVRAEEMGFDFVSANDHLHGHGSRYELWTMLSWIAARTSRIRVATRVLGVPYRAPAVVAKMAETFDRLSGGRLILGLGAGYSDEEFHALGLGERSPGEKLTGLEEAIRIMRGMWSEEEFTIEGSMYRTDHAIIEPKPEHRIPIWLGTFGDRGLALTGRLGDGWIPSLDLAPPGRARVMRERILSAAQEAGRTPDDITCVYNLTVRVGEGPDPDPSTVVGSPEAVAEQLLGFQEIGFTAFNMIVRGPNKAGQLERLASEVMPAFRGGVLSD